MDAQDFNCHNDMEVSSISKLDFIPTPTYTLRERARELRKRDWSWLLPVLLCLYAILKEIKVGEPFLFKYQTEYLNLTAEQITGEVVPADLLTF